MSDEIIGCECGYKGCKSGFYKTRGFCPKCGNVLFPEMEANAKQPKKGVSEILSTFRSARGGI